MSLGALLRLHGGLQGASLHLCPGLDDARLDLSPHPHGVQVVVRTGFVVLVVSVLGATLALVDHRTDTVHVLLRLTLYPPIMLIKVQGLELSCVVLIVQGRLGLYRNINVRRSPWPEDRLAGVLTLRGCGLEVAEIRKRISCFFKAWGEAALHQGRHRGLLPGMRGGGLPHRGEARHVRLTFHKALGYKRAGCTAGDAMRLHPVGRIGRARARSSPGNLIFHALGSNVPLTGLSTPHLQGADVKSGIKNSHGHVVIFALLCCLLMLELQLHTIRFFYCHDAALDAQVHAFCTATPVRSKRSQTWDLHNRLLEILAQECHNLCLTAFA
mmetsp:Transcript_80187/g.202819  ORF Transcript_80187/g.202819 Transcript_80187/m.202819 type:complete len:327 (+) Transcript_80187:1296-2276(+)